MTSRHAQLKQNINNGDALSSIQRLRDLAGILVAFPQSQRDIFQSQGYLTAAVGRSVPSYIRGPSSALVAMSE